MPPSRNSGDEGTRMHRWVWAGLAVLGISAPASAAEFGARADFWQGELSGDVKAESGTIPATKLSFSNLGMDTSESIPSGEVFVRLGKTQAHRLSLRYFEQSYRGETTLTQTVTFKTFTFAASTSLLSRLAMRDIDFRYAGDVWQGKREPDALRRPNAFWGILGIKTLDLRAELFSTAVGSAEESAVAPLPVVGLGGRWGLGKRFSLEAEAAGLAMDISDIRATFYEASASARWDFSPSVSLEGGWRTWYLGATIDSTTKVDLSATIQGPFVGLEGRF